MNISRDSLRRLIIEGRIGVIKIGKRKKILHHEIVRFEEEDVIKNEPIKVSHPKVISCTDYRDGKIILESIRANDPEYREIIRGQEERKRRKKNLKK